MAFYNNKYWLLSHIRNSFVSTDDSGVCDVIMVGQPLPAHLEEALNAYPDSADSDEEEEFNQSDSLDVQLDLEHRVRSDTAVRLERMELAKKRASKMKHIKWECVPSVVSTSNAGCIDFSSGEETNQQQQQPKSGVKSLLTAQLLSCTHLPENPYIKYAKFDGSAQVGIPTRKYRIFLTMLPEEQRNYPMTVVCIATAKIQDLIGLTCFKCSTSNGDIPLKPVTSYGLYITEEDGEVDRDFSSLDANECVAKFGFTCLGLVEEEEDENDAKEDEVKPAVIGGSEARNLVVEGGDGSSSAMMRMTSSSRQQRQAQQQQRSLADVDDLRQESIGIKLLKEHELAMEALLYKSYRVYVIYKLRTKMEIHLGVTGEKIEIDPVRPKSSLLLFNRHKPISHAMDSIASCEIVDARSSKSTFRIVYNFTATANNSSSTATKMDLSFCESTPQREPWNFKNYTFEADHTTAEDIVQKINMILEIRSSASRKEYLEMQAKKHVRKSFHLSKINQKR